MRVQKLTAMGAWALGDQVISSATNFLAGIVIARTVGPAGYGSFMLAFGTWIVLLGATRSMLVQPYTVAASGVGSAAWRTATGSTAAVVLGFGVVFGFAMLCVGLVVGLDTATGACFVTLGAFAAPLALQDFWRFAAFSQGSPRAAALNDGVWAVAQVGSLAIFAQLDALTPPTAIASWGIGALAGALFGLAQFGVRPFIGSAGRQFLRENAGLAGWFGLSNASYQAGSYGALVLVGTGAGPTGLGGLGSADNLMAPARLVAASGESLVLPIVSAAVRNGEQRSLRRLCTVYSLGSAVFFLIAGTALTLAGPHALRTLFGNEYVQFSSLLPAIGAAATVSGLASGVVIGFRALGEGRRLATIQVASSAAKIALVLITLSNGLTVVAWGLAAAEVVRTALIWANFEGGIARRWTSAASPLRGVRDAPISEED